MRSAVERYHELLTPEVGADSHEWLHRELAAKGLEFGGRQLCSVLRPRFLSIENYRLLDARSALVLSALEKARAAAMADSELRAQFGLVDWEESLIHDDPGFRDASPTSRLDAFWADGPDGSGLKFTEYNAETPAGAAYGDALTRAFLSIPVMADFRREYSCLPLPSAPGVEHSLLDAYRQWSGTREAPRVAIVDWSEVPTYSESARERRPNWAFSEQPRRRCTRPTSNSTGRRWRACSILYRSRGTNMPTQSRAGRPSLRALARATLVTLFLTSVARTGLPQGGTPTGQAPAPPPTSYQLIDQALAASTLASW